MKRMILALCLAIGFGGAVRAQSPEEAIRNVISRQIDAFQADDLAGAFGFASPMIKGMFGSPERFAEMVRNGYPMVWRPDGVRFTALRNEGERMVQSVLVTDQNGALHMLDYEMIETDAGWEINGVTIRRPAELGA